MESFFDQFTIDDNSINYSVNQFSMSSYFEDLYPRSKVLTNLNNNFMLILILL